MGHYDVARLAAYSSFQRRFGCDDVQAGLATLALHPVDSARRPVNRQLEKDLRKLSRRFARASKRARDSQELQELTYVVLSTYAYITRQCDDVYYNEIFERAALEAEVGDLDEMRLKTLKEMLG
jgi:hypothetical protein